MKKLAGLCIVLLLLLVLLPGSSEAQIRFGFKGYGGLNYLAGGDINKGGQGFGEFADDILGSYTHSGEFAPVHLGMNFGGEFIVQFSQSMGIGLGAGYLSAAKESEIEYSPTIPNVEFLWSPKISAVPITASFYYFMPMGSKMKLLFNAGLGYYFAKADFEYNWVFLAPINWDATTKGGGLGFHGGLGLEFNLSPMFGIVAEIMGRFAGWRNFEGSVVWTIPPSSSTTTYEGPLWIGDVSLGSLEWTWLWIDPSEPAFDNVQKAKVDFSGFSFVIGFIVRFGN